jgi:myo-inositol-1(or 4)-monophosphatase
MKELEIACNAARAAGELLCNYFRTSVHRIAGKPSYNLVTQADIEAERLIVEMLRQATPGYRILAEESHGQNDLSGDLWIVDPLDGTNNFVHGVPQFSVSIAYYRDAVPQCGVVYHPVPGDLYTAQRGAGSYRNGERVYVQAEQRLDEILVGVGFYYDRGAMMEATLRAIADFFRQHIHGIRRFGSAALDLCYVGCGHFGAFFEYELSPWDVAAGRLFVEEAGGKVTTCSGHPLPLVPCSVLATNGFVHQAALEIVQRHLPPERT